MQRRRFVQTLVSAVAVSAAPIPAAAEEDRQQNSQPASTAIKPGEFAYAPGAITGPLALGLRPPDSPSPLPKSARFKGVRYTGRYRDYHETIEADTWYPSWAEDGLLYSGFADGRVRAASGEWEGVRSYWDVDWWPPELWFRKLGRQFYKGRITSDLPKATSTGQAILAGDDAFSLVATPLKSSPFVSRRYEGYYPSANLFYKGVWYYGRYYCHRWLNNHNVPVTYELGGFGGFRISTDRGKTWQETPFDDENPLFPEVGRCSGGAPIKMGTPHFVDLGRELEHSPDGYAYLVGHGTRDLEGVCNWSCGDAVFLARVRPSAENINRRDAWEFFAGKVAAGHASWSKEFSKIVPIIEWPGHAGCVNITYHPGFRKYLGIMCSGWQDGDAGTYDTWIVEADDLAGPWSSVAYLKGMGGQPYFVCAPSKFLGPDNKFVLFYSANWREERQGVPSWKDPNGPPGRYSLCVAEFELIEKG